MSTDSACSLRHLTQTCSEKQCSTLWPRWVTATCCLLNLRNTLLTRGLEVNDIDTPPMSPSRRIIIEMAQRMQLEARGPTAEELLNPSGVTGATPRHSVAASPIKQSPAPLSLAQHLSGWQMDTSCNQRAQSKHAPHLLHHWTQISVPGLLPGNVKNR